MNFVSGKRFNQLVLSLYREGRDVPLAKFQDWSLEQVQALLPFDSAWWGNVTAESARVHGTHLYNCDPSITDLYPHHLKGNFFHAALMAHPGQCVSLSDLTTRANFVETPLYRNFGARFRMAGALGTALFNPSSCQFEFLMIWRHDPAQPFTEAERLMKELLMPHLVEAFRAVRMRHFLQARGARFQAWALVDEQGGIQDISPEFSASLRRHWPGWRGHQLPNPLAMCVQDGKPYTSKTLHIELTRSGNFRFLTEKARSMLDKLTPREREIASLFGRGNGASGIALVLSLSPTTVRNHIANCYKKLGVNNKAELAAICRTSHS